MHYNEGAQQFYHRAHLLRIQTAKNSHAFYPYTQVHKYANAQLRDMCCILITLRYKLSTPINKEKMITVSGLDSL